ncbi:MAG: universal stress protein [Burkholderiales bacterium]|nr:universal stress protein [Burkholderiales bacterium]
MYKHLFVPIDGSELSHRGMDGSIALAAQLGARITGFVVEPDLPLAAVSRDRIAYAQHIQEHEARNREHATALLAQFEARALAAGVEFTGSHVVADNIDDAIAQQAEQAGADMIVMVTHGRGALGELLFGSHTRQISVRSKLPLLVLH